MENENVQVAKKRIERAPIASKIEWPKTSDKEFSKRMFIIFMWAFFVHIVTVIVAESFFGSGGAATETLRITIPVYSTIFAAVIVKGGVENVFKGLGGSGSVTYDTCGSEAYDSEESSNG